MQIVTHQGFKYDHVKHTTPGGVYGYAPPGNV